ncbi:MAG: ATP-grasp domain-containing protein [Pirellulales bacterium]
MPPPRSEPRPHVVIVGASVRACAESANRAGWAVHAADLFGDVDLRRSAVSTQLVTGSAATGYPAGLPAAIAGFPPGPCIYTGGLENHPTVIEALARDRPLAGNAADVVRAVRDPEQLAAAVRGAGGAFPETYAVAAGLPLDGSFVVKPVASAGGRGISHWRGRSSAASPRPLRWQRFVAGESWSAAFVADGRNSRLLATSLQLIGRRWCGARSFAYCGSLDRPLAEIHHDLHARLDNLGATLAATFGLVGLVGIDFILDAHHGLHVIEVNPRPTASMELHERGTGESLARLHLEACGFTSPQPPDAATHTSIPGASIWSKAIVFASRTAVRPAPRTAMIEDLAAPWTEADGAAAIADIPRPGQLLPAGGPLVTIFARGDTAARSLTVLRKRVAEVRRLFAAAATTEEISPQGGVASPRQGRPRGHTA